MNMATTPEQDQDEVDIKTEVENIVTDRMSQYRNSILISQIQKTLPNVSSLEKRDSLHSALQEVTDKSLLKDSKTKQKQVVFQLPRKSIHTSEVTVEKYVVPGTEGELLSDAFVRRLSVPIADKREYRRSILISLNRKRKPWHTKVGDFLAKQWENFLSCFDFWHETLNIIEGRQGTAVLSYFLFVRWLLYMNITIFFLYLFFLILPQAFVARHTNHTTAYITQISSNVNNDVSKGNSRMVSNIIFDQWQAYDMMELSFTGNLTKNSSVNVIVEYCKTLYDEYVSNGTKTGFTATIQGFLQGTGSLEQTHLFTGFYTPFNAQPAEFIDYISIASLSIFLMTLVVCLGMMIQYSSAGVQEAFISGKRNTNCYANEIFSAWEYCIQDPTKADLQHSRVVLEIKTNLNEDRAAKKITRNYVFVVRILINIFVTLWLISCCYFIYLVTAYQMKELQLHALSKPGVKTFFIQFLPSITIVVLTSISPTVFQMLISLEKYSPQTEVNLSICRSVVLSLASIIVLINTFHQNVDCKEKDICGAGLNITCRSPRCWETYIGQQLYKLSITDMFGYIAVFLCSDAFKYFISQKFDNKFTRLLGIPTFYLPPEILKTVNSQTILWLGVFYSPLLPVVMIFKLFIIFYIKKTKVLNFCEPIESSYRASRINFVFILVLLISFFIVLIVQGFAIERIPPSRGCGPFQYLNFMTEAVPQSIRSLLSVLTSYWTIIIIVLIICIAIHHYWQICVFQKELLKRLKAHLVLQSYDKQFLLKSIADLTEGKSPEKSRGKM